MPLQPFVPQDGPTEPDPYPRRPPNEPKEVSLDGFFGGKVFEDAREAHATGPEPQHGGPVGDPDSQGQLRSVAPGTVSTRNEGQPDTSTAVGRVLDRYGVPASDLDDYRKLVKRLEAGLDGRPPQKVGTSKFPILPLKNGSTVGGVPLEQLEAELREAQYEDARAVITRQISWGPGGTWAELHFPRKPMRDGSKDNLIEGELRAGDHSGDYACPIKIYIDYSNPHKVVIRF